MKNKDFINYNHRKNERWGDTLKLMYVIYGWALWLLVPGILEEFNITFWYPWSHHISLIHLLFHFFLFVEVMGTNGKMFLSIMRSITYIVYMYAFVYILLPVGGFILNLPLPIFILFMIGMLIVITMISEKKNVYPVKSK